MPTWTDLEQALASLEDSERALAKLRVPEVRRRELVERITDAVREPVLFSLCQGLVGKLAYRGDADDVNAQYRYDCAISERVEEAAASAGFDLDALAGYEQFAVVSDVVAAVKAQNAVTTYAAAESTYGPRPITARSSRADIERRWAEAFPEADGPTPAEDEEFHRRIQKKLIDEGWKSEAAPFDPYSALIDRLFYELEYFHDKVLPDEFKGAMVERLGAEGICKTLMDLRANDVPAATSQFDKVTSVERARSRVFYNRGRVTRGRYGLEFLVERSCNHTQARAAVGLRCNIVGFGRILNRARSRCSHGSSSPLRGSRRVTSRRAGSGSSGDDPGGSDEPPGGGRRSGSPIGVVALLTRVRR
jgi:hypothetical protein